MQALEQEKEIFKIEEEQEEEITFNISNNHNKNHNQIIKVRMNIAEEEEEELIHKEEDLDQIENVVEVLVTLVENMDIIPINVIIEIVQI